MEETRTGLFRGAKNSQESTGVELLRNGVGSDRRNSNRSFAYFTKFAETFWVFVPRSFSSAPEAVDEGELTSTLPDLVSNQLSRSYHTA